MKSIVTKKSPLLLLPLLVALLSGCYEYEEVLDAHLASTQQSEATPDRVLTELLETTELSLNTSERKEMQAHIESFSAERRRVILAHLKTAQGEKATSQSGARISWSDSDSASYPIPSGETRVQFLQQLMTTSD
ncbi:hypothetical protein SR882_04280 [Guyparkeria halophila]|uniref:Uncharacterized protein n=1 Tax=Guyparkeria halophila TaxID=47960 RepID=A0ABZ0YY67_9GAMM|nr:hypothetical protein [Guyparkeria halophila]WQH17127.1 hypothetical protein SR882_04280 [Guyparkeria halophila]